MCLNLTICAHKFFVYFIISVPMIASFDLNILLWSVTTYKWPTSLAQLSRRNKGFWKTIISFVSKIVLRYECFISTSVPRCLQSINWNNYYVIILSKWYCPSVHKIYLYIIISSYPIIDFDFDFLGVIQPLIFFWRWFWRGGDVYKFTLIV